MRQTKPPEAKTTLERIQRFISMDGGVRRFFVWMAVGLGGWIVLLEFIAIFALASGARHPEPGKSYHVYIASSHGVGSWIYAEPWLGRFYEFLLDYMFIFAGALVVLAILLAIARKIFGDPPPDAPDMRGRFRSTDQG